MNFREKNAITSSLYKQVDFVKSLVNPLVLLTENDYHYHCVADTHIDDILTNNLPNRISGILVACLT